MKTNYLELTRFRKGRNTMKTLLIAATAASILTATSALAGRVCIDWNGVVLCGEEVLR